VAGLVNGGLAAAPSGAIATRPPALSDGNWHGFSDEKCVADLT